MWLNVLSVKPFVKLRDIILSSVEFFHLLTFSFFSFGEKISSYSRLFESPHYFNLFVVKCSEVHFWLGPFLIVTSDCTNQHFNKLLILVVSRILWYGVYWVINVSHYIWNCYFSRVTLVELVHWCVTVGTLLVYKTRKLHYGTLLVYSEYNISTVCKNRTYIVYLILILY